MDMAEINNNICKEHSGFHARIKDLEGNVEKLWEKWDGMQKLVVGIFVALILNLAGVILLLMTKGDQIH